MAPTPNRLVAIAYLRGAWSQFRTGLELTSIAKAAAAKAFGSQILASSFKSPRHPGFSRAELPPGALNRFPTFRPFHHLSQSCVSESQVAQAVLEAPSWPISCSPAISAHLSL